MSESPSPLHILITGGEGDLAQAIRAKLVDEGHVVRAPGRKELDVRDEAQVAGYIAGLEKIDILIANAGLIRDNSLANMTAEDFDEVLAINLRGAFLCVQAAVKRMVKQRSGHLVLIGSRSAKYGNRGQANYAAAKAGLVGLSMSVAAEYGARNIRCNVVLPGFLETKFTAALPEKRRDQIRSEHTLGRFNTVENSAKAIAFLAQLDHVSGQVFTLDSRLDKWT